MAHKQLFGIRSIFISLFFSIAGCHSHKKIFEGKIPGKNIDSCVLHTFYHENLAKRSEGLLCQGLREGVWREWYANGELMDSGTFKSGRRIYNDSLLMKIKGTVHFENDPKKFMIDSNYLFSVSLNQSYSYNDIQPYFLNFKTSDGEKYKFQRFELPLDSFCFVFTPKKEGNIDFILSLGKLTDHHTDERYVFYEKKIDAVAK